MGSTIVFYLISNITWKADYVVVLKKDDTSADISCWVSLVGGLRTKEVGL